MPMTDTSVLIVPGLNGSGPDHWQTIWEWTREDCVRVEQESWHDPHPAAWMVQLDSAIAAAPGEVVVVAHSLGCAAVAHWAANAEHAGVRVVAALLVAPCDVERPEAPAAIARFAPLPPTALPFRSLVVASSNDPYATLSRTRCFADRWGGAFVDVGPLGHINAASQLGDWPFGQILLDELLERGGGERYRRAATLRDGGTLPLASRCRPLG